MKKFLALFLVLAMLVSIVLVSCDKPDDDNNDDGDGLIIDDPDKKPGGDKDGEGGDEGQLPGDQEGEKDPPANQTTESAISATVYPMTKMVIRKDSVTSDVKVIVERAQALSAVAVIKDAEGTDLWYKLSYDNATYYIDADYVTQNVQKATFSDLTEALTITVKQHDTANNEDPYQVNLREYPSFDSGVKTVTVKKEHTDVNPLVAKAVNGTGDWYIVTYNGVDYYLAVTSITKPVLNGLPAEGGEGNLPG